MLVIWNATMDQRGLVHVNILPVYPNNIAGGEATLETLDLSAPGLIYKLVHSAVALELFHLSSKTSCKPYLHATSATKRVKIG